LLKFWFALQASKSFVSWQFRLLKSKFPDNTGSKISPWHCFTTVYPKRN
jgi:hypothetical protein